MRGDLPPGTPVAVVAASDATAPTIAYGFLEPTTECIRIFHHVRKPSYHSGRETLPVLNSDYWRDKVRAAYQHRVDSGVAYRSNNCYRLLNGDGDGTPGVWADVYGNVCRLVLLGDGPTKGILYAVRELMSTQLSQVRHFWLEYRPSGTAGWVSEDFPQDNDFVMNENGAPQVCLLTPDGATVSGGPLDNRLRGMRASLQVASADKDVLDVHGGAGYGVRAALAGKASSVMVLEDRPVALGLLKSFGTRRLDVNVIADGVADTLASIDSEAFPVVCMHVLPTPNQALDVEVRHAVRAVAGKGYLYLVMPWGRTAEALEAVRKASEGLRRPATVVRSFFPGPDYPVSVFESQPTEVALMIRVD